MYQYLVLLLLLVNGLALSAEKKRPPLPLSGIEVICYATAHDLPLVVKLSQAKSAKSVKTRYLAKKAREAKQNFEQATLYEAQMRHEVAKIDSILVYSNTLTSNDKVDQSQFIHFCIDYYAQ